MQIITVSELCFQYDFQYDSRPVLQNVSFSVESGEFVCMSGPNGAGKSTVLKILMKLLKPTSGYVRVMAENTAYLAQRAAFFNPDFPANVAEVVGLGLPKGVKNRRDRRDSIQYALKQVDMTDFYNKPIGRLSGGQQQRVLLAKALAQRPDLILLDEPTASIDNGTCDQICCLLSDLNKKEGLTIVMVTHDTHSQYHAHRVLAI